MSMTQPTSGVSPLLHFLDGTRVTSFAQTSFAGRCCRVWSRRGHQTGQLGHANSRRYVIHAIESPRWRRQVARSQVTSVAPPLSQKMALCSAAVALGLKSVTSTLVASQSVKWVTQTANINWGKAGALRWKGVSPTVRRCCEPVDSPRCGEGKLSGWSSP